MIQMLKMIERFDLSDVDHGFGFGALKTLHVMIEAMRLAFADRAVWMGDEDFVAVPGTGLLSDDYVAKRSAMIDADKRMDSPLHGNPWEYQTSSVSNNMLFPKKPVHEKEGLQTTHFTVIDRWHNIVSFTSTIESAWGTGIMVPGYGFVLNNELTDFNAVSSYDNQTGDLGANDAAANKRPRSSMTPSILFKDGKPIAAYGSPGGSTIINTVLQITLNLIDHKMTIQDAIDAPRLSVQDASGVLKSIESDFNDDVAYGLNELGHNFNLDSNVLIGSVQAIYIDPETGDQSGGADSRREGTVIKLPRK
jgi:gamma-glutamyltranspeptidase / glutathione hydrolase